MITKLLIISWNSLMVKNKNSLKSLSSMMTTGSQMRISSANFTVNHQMKSLQVRIPRLKSLLLMMTSQDKLFLLKLRLFKPLLQKNMQILLSLERTVPMVLLPSTMLLTCLMILHILLTQVKILNTLRELFNSKWVKPKDTFMLKLFKKMLRAEMRASPFNFQMLLQQEQNCQRNHL